MSTALIIKRKKSGAFKLVPVFLLMLYIAGSTSIELIHAVFHSDEVIVVEHTVFQEQDPCHRLIYHFDIEHGCKDDVHLVASNKCKMCDIAFHADQSVIPHAEFAAPSLSIDHFAFYKHHIDSYWAVIASSRAPPIM